MTEWFRESFREQYLWLYAHRDQEEARATVDLVAAVTGIAQGATVLDAPCGAGRHAREFARHGFATTALDLSAELIRVARQADPVTPTTYLRADLRAIPIRSSPFALVANLFSSFGYMGSDADNAAVLAELVRVCRPSGWIVIDFMNEPRVRSELLPRSERSLPQGWHAIEQRRIAGDPPRVEKHVVLQQADGTRLEITESVRLYTPEELVTAMTSAGCAVNHVLGDYHGAPHANNSPRCILFGRRNR